MNAAHADGGGAEDKGGDRNANVAGNELVLPANDGEPGGEKCGGGQEASAYEQNEKVSLIRSELGVVEQVENGNANRPCSDDASDCYANNDENLQGKPVGKLLDASLCPILGKGGDDGVVDEVRQQANHKDGHCDVSVLRLGDVVHDGVNCVLWSIANIEQQEKSEKDREALLEQREGERRTGLGAHCSLIVGKRVPSLDPNGFDNKKDCGKQGRDGE